ncbi:hypothetical protein LCGC14_0937900 [marine sediment metagenome]|uniref:Uncharacterized protein n=1 Tax=marine sediment metagenome TaxID=412755 RepID=A0A0F9NQK1_9ZZZZ|nr:hypothetical protein [Candidatus Aminicenantes bacterium]
MTETFIETVTHPKNRKLSINITFIPDNPETAYCGANGMCDGYPTVEEARKNVQEILEYIYSGEYDKDQQADKIYSRQEQIACGSD